MGFSVRFVARDFREKSAPCPFAQPSRDVKVLLHSYPQPKITKQKVNHRHAKEMTNGNGTSRFHKAPETYRTWSRHHREEQPPRNVQFVM